MNAALFRPTRALARAGTNPAQRDQDLAMLAQLGILDDPMQQVAGLVQLSNAIQQPQQFQQDLDLRRQAQEIGQRQFGMTFAQQGQYQQAGLDLKQKELTQQEQQAGRELMWKQTAEVDAINMRQKELDQMKLSSQVRSALELLGFLPNMAKAGQQMNPMAVSGYFNQINEPGLAGMVRGVFDSPTQPSVARTPYESAQEQIAQDLYKQGKIKTPPGGGKPNNTPAVATGLNY